MNAPTLATLDHIVAVSLWCFLGALLALLLFALTRLRRRRRKLGELYAAGNFDQSQPDAVGRSLLDEWRILLHSSLAALILAILVGVALAFLPLPWADHPTERFPREILPLRLTALEYDRFYEGFKLSGEVWNQTESPLDGVQAAVTVIGLRDETLSVVSTPVQPSSLAAGTAGTFQFEYRENSPFIRGYRLSFQDAAGTPLPHTAGFDAR